MSVILCIEDDPDDFFLMSRRLKGEGIECRLHNVRSLQEAEDYLCGENQFSDRARFPFPDLIVTDLAFRGGTGLEFLQWLRSKAELASITVICVTGSDDPNKLEQARLFGAPCVPKSASYSELATRVRQLLPC